MICHSNSLINDFLKRNRTSGAFQCFCRFHFSTLAFSTLRPRPVGTVLLATHI